MTFEEIYKLADNEADWLKYYGERNSRESENFEDDKFYDRLLSIGYAKVNTPLPIRCSRGYVSSERPVIESDASEIEPISGPRNHDKNVYTPLEYIIGGKKDGYKDLIAKIKK